MADTPTDTGTGTTTSNPAGQISAGVVSLDDANLHTAPDANRLRLRENAVNLTPDPTCANAGANNQLTLGLDIDEASGANAWTQCFELKSGPTSYTTSAGNLLATVVRDSAGTVTRVELYPDASITDYGAAATTGTIAWAATQLTGGGEIFLHPGTYGVATTITLDQSGTVLRCASPGDSAGDVTQIRANNTLNADVIRLGHAGAVRQTISVIGCTLNGNSANNTAGDLISIEDVANWVVERNRFVGREEAGVRIAATAAAGSPSTVVLGKLGPNNTFVGASGSGSAIVQENAGGDPTDTHIFDNDIGGTGSVDGVSITSALGVKITDNHIYGAGGVGDCLVLDEDVSTTINALIASNVIESCEHHGIVLADVSSGTLTGNLFYEIGEATDNTYDAINATASNSWSATGNYLRSATSTGNGVTRDLLNLTTANNWTVVGNEARDIEGYAVRVASTGTNLLAMNYAHGSNIDGQVSDSITSDRQINPDATYGWLVRDGLGVLPDGSNGVNVDGTTGVLAKVGTGSVQADDVVCTGCVGTTDASGLDISADTNLAVTAPIVLTDDTLSCASASGAQAGCLSSTDWTTFNGKASSAFSTMDAPAGTDPVADSATDTLTLSAAGSLTITGNSTTDTLTFDVTETDPGVPLLALADYGDVCAANESVARNGGDTANVCITPLTAEVDGSTTNEIQNLFETINAPSGTDPVADTSTDTLNLAASGIVTITGDSTTDTLTIGATEVDGSTTNELQNLFATIDAPAGTDPVADATSDTLTLAAGGIVTITGDSSTDTLTISATEVDGSTSNEIEVVDEAYSAANFNGATTQAVSQDDLYDLIHAGDADDDGKPDILDTTTNGFVKTTGGTGAISIDTSTYLTAEVDGSTTNELQNLFATVDASSGTDPVADANSDTLVLAGTAPVTVTGDSSTDTITVALSQHAGTDVTADLEEEAHAGEHSLGGGDAITATNLASACTNGQVLGGTVAGTGVECQADVDTDTNASTLCAGTTTYLDGEGNCDDISSVYAAASHAHAGGDITSGTVGAAYMPSGTNTTTWTTDADNTGGTEPADGAGFLIEGGTGDVSLLWDATSDYLVLSSPISGSLVGNASTATALQNNPTETGCGTGSASFATAIDASGNLTCGQVDVANATGTLGIARLNADYGDFTCNGSTCTLEAGPATTNGLTFTVDADNGGTEPANGAGYVVEGGSGTNISMTYDATGNDWEFAGAAGGYTFDGPINVTASDGSRGSTFQDNTTEPSAPSSGYTLLYSLGGEFYKKDNGDGTNERLILTNDNVVGDITLATPSSGTSTASIGIDKVTPSHLLESGNFTALTGAWQWNDSAKIKLGTGSDTELYYDGTDAILDPDVVGTGALRIGGATELLNGGATYASGSNTPVTISDAITVNGTSTNLYHFAATDTVTVGDNQSLAGIVGFRDGSTITTPSDETRTAALAFWFAFSDGRTISPNTTTGSATIGYVDSYQSAPTISRSGSSNSVTISSLRQFEAAAPTLSANTTTSARVGFYVADPAPTGTLTAQAGVDIEFLDGAGSAAVASNIGVRNASTTVYTPQTQAVAAASTTISCNSTYKKFTTVTGTTTMTSNPTISDGVEGQQCVLTNVDATGTDCVTLPDGSTGLQLGAARTLCPNDTITLYYNGTDWIEAAWADN